MNDLCKNTGNISNNSEYKAILINIRNQLKNDDLNISKTIDSE